MFYEPSSSQFASFCWIRGALNHTSDPPEWETATMHVGFVCERLPQDVTSKHILLNCQNVILQTVLKKFGGATFRCHFNPHGVVRPALRMGRLALVQECQEHHNGSVKCCDGRGTVGRRESSAHLA